MKEIAKDPRDLLPAQPIAPRLRFRSSHRCYHGTVDETFATLRNGVVGARDGNLGQPVDPALTTRLTP